MSTNEQLEELESIYTRAKALAIQITDKSLQDSVHMAKAHLGDAIRNLKANMFDTMRSEKQEPAA